MSNFPIVRKFVMVDAVRIAGEGFQGGRRDKGAGAARNLPGNGQMIVSNALLVNGFDEVTLSRDERNESGFPGCLSGPSLGSAVVGNRSDLDAPELRAHWERGGVQRNC